MNLRQAWRRSVRAPGFALTVVLLVAGVVAINATLFSALHALRWRALPYADGDRLVAMSADLQKLGFVVDIAERFRAQLERDPSIAGAMGYTPSPENRSDDAKQTWSVLRIDRNWTDVLGVSPALGRAFVADDFVGERASAAIVSDRTWRTRLGGDRSALGRTIRLDGDALTVIGVMPAGFGFPDSRVDAWIPRVVSAAERRQEGNTSIGDLGVVVRLAPGATVQSAQDLLEALLVADERVEDLRTNVHLHAKATAWRDRFAASHLQTLGLLQLAGVLLLLAVIANLVNLHLDRLLGRTREFQIRRAVGARDGAIVGGIVGDIVPLVLVGFALGMAATPLGLRVLAQRELLPANLPSAVQFGGVTLAAAVVAALCVLAGVAISVHGLRRTSLTQRAGVGRTGRARGAMLLAQVTLTTVLLGCSGLLLRSAFNLLAVHPGFDPRGVLITAVSFKGSDDGEATIVSRETVETVRAGVASVPGVDAVAVADILPFTGTDFATKLRVPGIADEQQARQREIGTGYFAAMGIALLRGRDFTGDDMHDPRPVVVDERYVERYLRDVDPLTATVEMPGEADGTFTPVPIIGVVRTVKNETLDEVGGLPTLYVPSDVANGSIFLVTRTALDPVTLIDPVRKRIAEFVPDATLGWHQPLRERVVETLAPRRALIELVGAFALATLLLAAFGLASVLGVAVRRRESEFGVRLAIGATAAHLRALVLRQGGAMVLVGVALGVAIGVPLARLMAARLFGLAYHDAATWLLACAVVACVALLACWLPARRAASGQPASVLRSE